MKEFTEKSNINRALTSKEAQTYNAFLKVKEIFKKGNYDKNREIDHLSIGGNPLFSDAGPYGFINNKHKIIGAFWDLKPKGIEFSAKFDGIEDRYLHLTREFSGMGNGSYYIYDAEKCKVVLKEDD